jgi:2-methylcitrate dehydratase PrpD
VTITETMAEHFASTDYQALAPDRCLEMKRLILDYLGVALAGSAMESGRIPGELVIDIGGAAEATVLGAGRRVPAVHAAFANAISAHSIELDDVDELALFHYGPPIVSAALAMAEREHATGAQLLNATLAGCEMMVRLSRASNPSLRDRGFHTTPVCGAFGAAVSACLLLGLGAAPIADALGLAGAQASGLMEMYGPSMQKRVNPGPAARNGIMAALLASRGFTGAGTIIEGQHGFGRAFTDHFDPAMLTADLGARVPVFVEYKPYSCARPIHNAIDGILKLRSEFRLLPHEVKEIVVHRHPDWTAYHRNASPRTYHEAQVSLPYSVAVALLQGRAMPADYADDRLTDEVARNLSRAVKLETDPSLPRGVSCRVAVVTHDGDRYETQVDYPLGSLQRPLSDDDLIAKFTELATPRLGPARAADIASTVLAAEGIADLSEFTRLLD